MTTQSFPRGATLCAAGLLISSCATARAGCGRFKSTVDNIVAEQLTAKKKMPVGMVIGVFSDGKECYYSYGETFPGSGVAPDKKSIFEIGSITKTFNGLLFANRVLEGKLSQDDNAQQRAPAGLRVAATAGKTGADASASTSTITLGQLLTHYSGLPDFPKLDQVSNIQNPFADFTEAKTIDVLTHTALDSQPGTVYEYSNMGAALLGMIIENGGKADYAALVSAEILKPLGMKNTAYEVGPKNADRVVRGFMLRPGYPPAQPWDAGDGMRGAVGLRSTASDLMRYLRAHISPENTPISAALAQSHIPVRNLDVAACPQKAVAYGWNIGWCEPSHDLDAFYSHAGQTGGFRNFAGFDAKAGKAVVVLSNSADTYTLGPGQAPGQEIDIVGGEIMRALVKTK